MSDQKNDILSKLGQNENIKKMGTSPYAKKKRVQSDYQVSTKMSRDLHMQVKIRAAQDGINMYQELDKLVKAGIEALEIENR